MSYGVITQATVNKLIVALAGLRLVSYCASDASAKERAAYRKAVKMADKILAKVTAP